MSVQERKNRTRKLITLGGLVSKAKLEDWNANALLGALLFVKEKEVDTSQMNEWIHKGGMAFFCKAVGLNPQGWLQKGPTWHLQSFLLRLGSMRVTWVIVN